MRTLRMLREWGLLLLSIAALSFSVVCLLPPRRATLDDLTDPPFLRVVEVTVDRVQPLPWEYHDRRNRVTRRFALGWIGDRALLLRADAQIPSGLTFDGIVQRIPRPERDWVKQDPLIAAVVYPAELDASANRVPLAIIGLALNLVALAAWIWLFRARRAKARTAAPSARGWSRLDVPPPRSRELAVEMARKHAPFPMLLLYFLLYAMLVMVIPGIVVAAYLDPQFWELDGLRQVELIAIGVLLSSPLTALPFLVWARRQRASLERLVRDGVVVDGTIAFATIKNAETELPYTVIDVDSQSVWGRFRGHVRGVPPWCGPHVAVRMLAVPHGRRVIVIAPTGEDFVAQRA